MIEPQYLDSRYQRISARMLGAHTCEKVLCVSAGQLQVKKSDNPISRKHRYLNYGLLSLATVLSQNGFGARVMHGHFERPEHVFREADEQGLIQESRYPILLSLPSFYAVDWAREFMSHVKSAYPKKQFLVGGRWVVGQDPERVKKLLPDATTIIGGVAEHLIVNLVGGAVDRQIAKISANGTGSSYLDYRLLHQRELYQPSIEVSRGCGMGCSFCQEKDERLQPLKAAETVVAELQEMLLKDDLVEMTPYFEASMFVPTLKWASQFRSCLDRAEFAPRWRSEGRVDNIRPEVIPDLAAAGLSVLDLGLESASLTQLARMKKSKKPSAYLERASKLLEACALNGVKVKINILLFAGETDDSIAETLAWLDARKDQFYGVSAGPVIVYGWPDEVGSYVEELELYGASIHDSPCLGVSHLNLSPDIDCDRARQLALQISRRYMDAERYFFLKSFSYFGRDYQYEDFVGDVVGCSFDTLSFDSSALRNSSSG